MGFKRPWVQVPPPRLNFTRMDYKQNSKEKREGARIEKHLIIQFSVDSGASVRKWDVSSIQDISEKGVSFLANGRFLKGAKINMMIRIPLRPFEWFEVAGTIVAVEGPKNSSIDSNLQTSLLRISFLELEEKQKALIHEYISWCLSNLRHNSA